MGIYINPKINTSYKDKFIQGEVMKGNAFHVSATTFLDHTPGNDGLYGIVLVDNGAFDALGVAYDKGEAKAFAGDASDPRFKSFYLANINKIAEWDEKAADQLRKMAT